MSSLNPSNLTSEHSWLLMTSSLQSQATSASSFSWTSHQPLRQFPSLSSSTIYLNTSMQHLFQLQSYLDNRTHYVTLQVNMLTFSINQGSSLGSLLFQFYLLPFVWLGYGLRFHCSAHYTHLSPTPSNQLSILSFLNSLVNIKAIKILLLTYKSLHSFGSQYLSDQLLLCTLLSIPTPDCGPLGVEPSVPLPQLSGTRFLLRSVMP